jgi:hypothetical protein
MAVNKFASKFTGSFLLFNLCATVAFAAPTSIAVDSAGKKNLPLPVPPKFGHSPAYGSRVLYRHDWFHAK